MSSTQDFPPAELRGIVAEVTGLLVREKQSVCVVELGAGGLISSSLLSADHPEPFFNIGMTPPPDIMTRVVALEHPDSKGAQELRAMEARHLAAALADVGVNMAEKDIDGFWLKGSYIVVEFGAAGPSWPADVKPRVEPGCSIVAVGCDKGLFVKETDTGLAGAGRAACMKRFALEALTLLKAVIDQAEGVEALKYDLPYPNPLMVSSDDD